jgi:hypothetical protein
MAILSTLELAPGIALTDSRRTAERGQNKTVAQIFRKEVRDLPDGGVRKVGKIVDHDENLA